MSPLTLRLGGALAAVLALLAASLWLHGRLDLARVGTRHNACLRSLAGKREPAPALTCDPPIAALVARVAQDDGCDQALAAGAAGGGCSAPVKRLAAERDARAAESADLRAQLDQARSDQTAAVARAAARGQALARKSNHAQAVLDAAPRDGAGDAVFDDQRLRDLSGPDPAALDR